MKIPRRAILLPLIFFGLATASIAYFLNIAADRENAIAHDNSLHLVRTAIDVVRREVGNWTKDYAYWDETLAQVNGPLDVDWAESNVGEYMQEAFGISGSFMISPEYETVFSSPKDGPYADISALLGDQTAAFLSQVQSVPMDQTADISTFVMKEGTLVLVVAAVITAESPTESELVRRPRPVLAMYKEFKPDFVAHLASMYLLDDMVIQERSPGPESASDVVQNFRGAPVAYIVWSPPAPGDALVVELLPRILIAVVILLLAAFLVFYFWWRAASEASDAKSNFLAKMSHELRTPLNPIIGYSEAMTGEVFGPLSDRYKTYAGDIHRCGQDLLGIIDDILDVSRIEAGKLELHETEFDVVKLIRQLPSLDDLLPPEASDPAGDGADRSVEFQSDGEIPLLRGDELRVRQVVVNLLTNAAKHSGSQEIGLHVSVDSGGVKIVVEDKGEGISRTDLNRLFLPFSQLEHAHVRGRSKGTGLGLTLSRELMHMHGGDLVLESDLGVGTRAIMTFPSERTVVT